MRIPKSVIAAFVALALTLVGLNVALVKEDRRLAALYKIYEARFHLNAGAMVPALTGTGSDGRPVTVAYKSGHLKTLMLVFARSCSECAVNWPEWQKLLGEIDLARVRPIGVSVESSGLSSQYLTQVGMARLNTVLLPDFESITSYRFQYTPQTILIGSNGKVEDIWSGVLNPKQISEIQQAVLSPESVPPADGKTAQSP